MKNNTSILLIQSQQPNNTSIGTGFIIHQDEYGSYLLTCAHVVKQVEEPIVRGLNTKEIALDEELDLALLYVRGLSRIPLKLRQKKCVNNNVELIGFSNFSRQTYQIKKRKATLLENNMFLRHSKSNQEIKTWEVIAKENHEIESGNSGGPLICEETGNVIAVVSNRRASKKGYAVSIEHLKDIWVDIPPFLFESDSQIESPFVGLSAFSIEQAHLFFGRDREIEEIFEKFKENRVLTIVGDSGSGKSSLVKAGVIPKYRNQVIEYISEGDEELRVIEDNQCFFAIDIRPVRSPFDELAHRIDQLGAKLKIKSEKISHLKSQIRAKQQGCILDAMEQIFYKKEDANLLIYIDQFEELFTLCSNTLQKEFIDELLYLLDHQSEELNIEIVLTIRKDYYNLISEYERFFELTQKGKYTLHRMQNEKMLECIEEPLKLTSINEQQIKTFAKVVQKDMGDESSELTLLEIALTQTWKERKSYDNDLLKTYHEIGEVSGALAKLADNTYKILDEHEKEMFQYIMLRVVKLNDTGGVTRRLADREEFSGEVWYLAQRLASSLDNQGLFTNEKSAKLGRLLIMKGTDGSYVELIHEALVRQWYMYQTWIKNASENSLKRVHERIIRYNAIYRYHQKKGKFRFQNLKFLLQGYELERSKDLFSNNYKKYCNHSAPKKEIW
ncbi:ATP-binding protein [bacterium]|nr:ATP-binding protein [bacterium]MBU1959225.1 ATP-binding protein [bacterium]